MRFELGEPVPYDATAARPDYGTLPEAVRADVAAHLGGEPVNVAMAGGGFTGGFAGTLTSAHGRRLFVKAGGPHNPFVVSAYSAEAHISPALPEAVPSPAMRFASEVDGWVVLGFDAIDGRAARLPMSPRELDLMLDAWARAADALTPAPRRLVELGLPKFHEVVGNTFHNFSAVLAGELPAPDLPVLTERFADLAALEVRLNAAIDVDAVHHGDLRPDNMILTDERAWICDWNNPVLAATWFDTIAFLVLAHGDGHDADGLLRRQPSLADVDDEQVDIVLAAIAGYYLCNSDKPKPEGVSPYIRRHQRWNGLATLDWLASRRGW